MNREELENVVREGESLTVEFKRCGNKPGRDVFETICAFANRQGGNLLLGVLDDGEVCARRDIPLPVGAGIALALYPAPKFGF